MGVPAGTTSEPPRIPSGRVVGLDRHEDGAVATVGDLVETVVEELAEDREQRVERRREADVGGDVGDVEGVAVTLDTGVGVGHGVGAQEHALIAL
jgi:hypothetical protein